MSKWKEKKFDRQGVLADIKGIRQHVLIVINDMIKNKKVSDTLLLELLIELEYMCEYYPSSIKKNYPISAYKWVR